MSTEQYEETIAGTKKFFESIDVNALPAIFSYWANKYLAPMFVEFGFTSIPQFHASHLVESARRCKMERPLFASVGAGVCVTEVDVARQIRNSGLNDFTIDCIELSGTLLAQGRQSAVDAGVEQHLRFIEADFNFWHPDATYHGIMVQHALHHVVNLEGLLDRIKASLDPRGLFTAADMIGRNGHQRWPEALVHLHRFWQELPPPYRYNRILQRQEDLYENWDCSTSAFEGIRAQDILPLLLERFDFEEFIAFGNVIDVFIDRCFGHNFDADGVWDRHFIDRVHAFDEAAIQAGTLTPTQMLAVMTPSPSAEHKFSRGLVPARCVRVPD